MQSINIFRKRFYISNNFILLIFIKISPNTSKSTNKYLVAKIVLLIYGIIIVGTIFMMGFDL